MLLDGSLGFAAGVMLAASYWSLLAPALEFAETSGTYGAHTYIPVCIGLLAGAAFVWGADQLIPHGAGDAVAMLTQQSATNTSNGSVGRTDGRSKKHDSEDEQTSQRLLQHQHQPPPPPPLQRAGSLSRKRNISSGRLSHILSDEAFDDMEAHRMPPTHAAGMGGGGGGSGGGKGNKLKQSPPPAGVLPGSGALTRSQSRSGSGKKGGGRASSSARLMSDMVPVDEVAEHDGLPVVWNSQQQRPFTTHSSSSGQDGLARDQQQQQQSQSQLQEAAATLKAQSWRRILLLVIAIVIHNFPEGLAVGVGFGALNDLQPVSGDAASTDAAAAALSPEEELSRQSAYAARFSEAVTLAFGIGLQNFPGQLQWRTRLCTAGPL
jgi:zinc transporter ZupT